MSAYNNMIGCLHQVMNVISKYKIIKFFTVLSAVLAPAMSAGPALTHAADADLALLAKKTREAVVLILAYDETGTMVSQGSGFIVNPNGTLVTNVHVIEKASSAVAKFANGAYYEVKGLLAIDCAADLAVIKLKSEKTEFPHIKLADTKSVKLGNNVFCIGNPLTSSVDEVSTEGTLSAGIISGIRSRGEQGIRVFQTTAPISSGSSGGPLFNDKGEVIGVITFEIANSQNLNFAVSIDHLRPLLEGTVARPLNEMLPFCRDLKGTPEKTDMSDPSVISGIYSGKWKSNVFSITGAAVVKVNIEGNNLYAKAILTGSPAGFKGGDLVGKVKKFDENIWTAELVSEDGALNVSAIFKDNTFIGDYRFQFRDPMFKDEPFFKNETESDDSTDMGHWELSK